MKKKFQFHRNCVFQMTFENGLTVSLSSVGGSYSDNRYVGYLDINSDNNEVELIEVACWKSDDDIGFVRLGEYDDMLGYIPTDQVASIIAVIAKAKNEEEITEGIAQLGIE